MVVTERPGQDDVSTLHDVLAATERRLALEILEEADGAETLTILATKIAARETGRPTSEVRFDRIRDVRVDLHHNHIPRLAEREFVAYDAEERVVRLVENERTQWLVERLDDVGGQ